MSERPTHKPASSATDQDRLRLDERPADAGAHVQPDTGQSLAARAERFRNGAPFLVQRATLYDPEPLEQALPQTGARVRTRQPLLPAALTLLGVVIVVGLAAAVLFVRNADEHRHEESAGRLGRFAERGAPDAARETPGRHDQVTYDLTRRSNDRIVGAWRPPKEIERRSPADRPAMAPPIAVKSVEAEKAKEEKQAGPVATPPSDEPPRAGLRRLLPRRLTGWLPKRTAEPAAPPRAPLDDPYVRKSTAESEVVDPRAARPDAAAAPKTAPPGTADRPDSVVARVGRSTEPREGREETDDRRGTTPIGPAGKDAKTAPRDGIAARSNQRAQLRRMRDARRQAEDVDRFLLREKGDIPKGFVFSGPQSQRP